MNFFTPVDQVDKLTRIWSERREREILVRLQYRVEEASGCKLYQLDRVDELD